MSSSGTPRIYFKQEPVENLDSFLKDTKTPGHEKIGAIFSKAIAAIKGKDKKELIRLLRYLGVSRSDREARSEMKNLLNTLNDPTVRILPTENSGIYFIEKQDPSTAKFKKVAVFKVGRKRAAIETAARVLANALGLQKHIIAGMFCALLNPELEFEGDEASTSDSEEKALVEELWNGLNKFYGDPVSTETSPVKRASESGEVASLHSDDFGNYLTFDAQEMDQFDPLPGVGLAPESSLEEPEGQEGTSSEWESTACAVVGIVQPFLTDQPEASLYNYTLMTILAIAIGLRDGKKDGYMGSSLFDVDDCFPVRIDPIRSNEEVVDTPSAIDMPYLDGDERTMTKLSHEEIKGLYEIVKNWSISNIDSKLKKLKIAYEDTVAEEMLKNSVGYDEGYCKVNIQEAVPHLINGNLNHLTGKNLEKRRILLDDQVNACLKRLERLSTYIEACRYNEQRFCPLDLVHAVDIYGKAYHDALSNSQDRSVGQLIHSRGGSSGVTGRTTPAHYNLSLSQDSLASLSNSATPTPTPSTTPPPPPHFVGKSSVRSPRPMKPSDISQPTRSRSTSQSEGEAES